MLPTGDILGDWDIGSYAVSAPHGKRGETEAMFKEGWFHTRVSVLDKSELARDAFAAIKKAPALDGVTEYLHGVQSFSAAYNKGKAKPFSEKDRELIEGALVDKTLRDLDEYKSSWFDDAVAHAERTIKHAVTAAAMLSDNPTTKKSFIT